MKNYTNIRFTISARGKKEDLPVDKYLSQNFPNIPFAKIDSVFGFVEPSALYSGRPFLNRQLSDADYKILQKNGIGLRLPLTNHYCSREEYSKTKTILDKYHKKGNSIICTNRDLAQWLRRDYPEYKLEASILLNLDTKEKIDSALDLFDTVVLPMNLNNKPDFLKELDHKDRITLFGNAGCALTCPERICYEYVSRKNKKLATKSKIGRYIYFFYHICINHKWCQHRIKPRKMHGVKDFDLDFLISLGYSRFKILRENKELQTGY